MNESAPTPCCELTARTLLIDTDWLAGSRNLVGIAAKFSRPLYLILFSRLFGVEVFGLYMIVAHCNRSRACTRSYLIVSPA